MPVSSTSRHFSGLSSTYSTSYGSGASSISRASAGQKASYGTSYSTAGDTRYPRPRPVPAGPGPLDSSGAKLHNYQLLSGSDTVGRRNRTPVGYTSTRLGPLKADHTSSFTTGTTSRYLSETKSNFSSVSRPLNGSTVTTNNFGGDKITTRPRSGSARPRKSNSLIDLSDLSISSNSTSSRNRAGSVVRERNFSPCGNALANSNTSSRNSGNYRDNNSHDLFGQSGRVSGGLEYDRPDGTSRGGYTPSMSRESSPPNAATRRVTAPSGDRMESSSKSSSSNQSSTSSMSNGASKYRDGGRVGLANLGNTCFMNSVLQCLSNTRLLVEWCLGDRYQQDINISTSNMKGQLVKAYAQLMQSLWKEQSDSKVSPNAFKSQIQRFAPRFTGYAQQDCQEFLRYLLEGLHEDVNRVTRKPPPIILSDEQLEKKNDHGKAQDYWKAYLNRDNSMIVDVFVGQLKSELKFSSCSHRSVTFDPFWDLSLPIPKNTSSLTLDDCIRLFMKEEELAAEERPMCAKCKSRRSCMKSFSIQRFPQILVLHLKRFSQERFGRKLTTLVNFPITNLDLSEHSAEGRSGGQRVLYDLYAVSNHSGGVSSGHYTAYCKNPYTSEWLYYNDARVMPVRSADQVVSAEAYVLFYQLTSQPAKA